MRINVQNGTNAGIKRPFMGVAPDWYCPVHGKIKGYWASCPDCEAKRGTNVS